MKHIKSPMVWEPRGVPSVFLAGSIEMGLAPLWQGDFALELSHLDIDILDPRRDHWDPSWVQSIQNHHFTEQVEWELTGIEKADVVAMYLAPGTKSPISLMEIGIYAGLLAQTSRLVICCPEGFWRRGNVEVVCQRYSIPLMDTLEALLRETALRISRVL